MSGVIMEDGSQWERCNCCGEFARIEQLRYMRPNARFLYGLDLCPECAPIPAQVRATSDTGLAIVLEGAVDLLARWGPLNRESPARHCRASRLRDLVEHEIAERQTVA